MSKIDAKLLVNHLKVIACDDLICGAWFKPNFAVAAKADDDSVMITGSTSFSLDFEFGLDNINKFASMIDEFKGMIDISQNEKGWLIINGQREAKDGTLRGMKVVWPTQAEGAVEYISELSKVIEDLRKGAKVNLDGGLVSDIQSADKMIGADYATFEVKDKQIKVLLENAKQCEAEVALGHTLSTENIRVHIKSDVLKATFRNLTLTDKHNLELHVTSDGLLFDYDSKKYSIAVNAMEL